MANSFTEVEVLQDHDDQLIVSPLTFRLNSQGEKLFSFSLLRRINTDDGLGARTPWFHRRHIARLTRFLPEIEQRLVEHEAKALEERAARGTYRRAR